MAVAEPVLLDNCVGEKDAVADEEPLPDRHAEGVPVAVALWLDVAVADEELDKSAEPEDVPVVVADWLSLGDGDALAEPKGE